MENFTFQNPTRLIFGKGSIEQLNSEITPEKRIMVCFGGGSAKKNGVYEQVKQALSGHFTVEFWGIEPNPDYDTVMKAVALARENNIDFLLAVGGGSVIDATKFIAHAIPYKGEDAWQLAIHNDLIKESTPLGVILTLPATGSEMNHRGVLSRRKTKEKVSFISPFSFPKFAILDPVVTFTLPEKQLTNGVVDSFMHIMEQYMTSTGNSVLMDRWAEGVLLSLIELGPKVLADKTDYDTMANFMLCATMALNGFTGMGVPQDWATHRIGYELTILYGLDHAETLAVVYPALLKILKNQKMEKLAQYAERVWGIQSGSITEKADLAIQLTEGFFRKMGMKTHMKEYGIPPEAIDIIYNRLKKNGAVYGENKNVDAEMARKIFAESY
ncbi:iron-containing alcohol dehydrogenase [Coprobacter tertius]|uniref:Iron-containing alcohol dehydrogenase n=1 Tax=Coprobacter tertius TaxID=2944915 RepID=A0ABT1MHC9_9BACT|nr:iron-containing alcohol dehydrogenase [Coprobacter tertius]MCP9612037.1 iron-containing alcohol dehydrogenase [Coprobacter tertius]